MECTTFKIIKLEVWAIFNLKADKNNYHHLSSESCSLQAVTFLQAKSNLCCELKNININHISYVHKSDSENTLDLLCIVISMVTNWSLNVFAGFHYFVKVLLIKRIDVVKLNANFNLKVSVHNFVNQNKMQTSEQRSIENYLLLD